MIRIALLVHSFAAILLIITVIVHAYAAFWVKGSIRSMVEGWVTRGWAKNTILAGIVKYWKKRKRSRKAVTEIMH